MQFRRLLFSCKSVAIVTIVDYGFKCIRKDDKFLTSQCTASSTKSLYCTADDGLLNDSNIAASSGFFVKYDSRTRNPKFVVQRSVDVSDVSNVRYVNSRRAVSLLSYNSVLNSNRT